MWIQSITVKELNVQLIFPDKTVADDDDDDDDDDDNDHDNNMVTF